MSKRDERAKLTTDVWALGEKLADIRSCADQSDMPFVNGILQGAESALLKAHEILSDSSVREDQL